ncbi:Mediator of RNA polymerase II transcription subunit [Nesidiocoris tenuis]|uniref:Mediator of RNA polymerase II transcription subunit 13 n=1 Tax=Nesidiocoris tenuis TaxID=355587 RepID=A0ABN7ATQ5_9HEMI|nr:Mediator of RNA polymerase II transcription subunit [Nesidiocoris tenuis]
MTNPINQTNGASLEDCHTNFFALTDLCGIKWRKLVWADWCEVGGEVLEDPVLWSYVRCLAADVLCVWRRVSAPPPAARSQDGGGGGPGGGGGGSLFDQLGLAAPPAPAPHPPLSLTSAKELWIFWYGEEPDLSNYVSPDLLSSEGGEHGSWESGLSYECRSLLFKALHNLIERCLLSRDFVRLGKWYVQPYDSSTKVQEKSGHFSFAFDFFVHGESTVCASVDVRTHPPVRTLLNSHLQQAQTVVHSSPQVHVILAPFGLAGTLTGQSFRAIDPHTLRLLEGWRHFYPIDKGLGESSDLPPFVEVLVGGHKMRYPSCYVLITDMDESTPGLFHNQLMHTPSQPIPPPKGVNRAGLLAERVWQETCVMVPTHPNAQPVGQGGSQPQQSSGMNSSVPTPLSVAPSTPNQSGGTTPNTLPGRSMTPVNTSGSNLSSSNTSTGNSNSTNNNNSAATNNNIANPQLTPGQWNFADPLRKQACQCSCKRSKTRVVSTGLVAYHRRATAQPSSDRLSQRLSCGNSGSSGGNGGGNGNGGSATAVDSVPIASVGSPTSAAPSPAVPTSVPPPPDPTMPTLSPQPPPPQQSSPLDDNKVVSTPIDFNAPKSVSSISNQVLSPYGENVKSEPIKTPLMRTPGGAPAAPTPPPLPPAQTLKRPVLKTCDYEAELNDYTHSDLLYDYSIVEAWLNHPVKKFKPNPPQQQPIVPKLEPISQDMEGGIPFTPRKIGDPYEFDEDGLDFKRGFTIKQEDDKNLVNGGVAPIKSSNGNLFTKEGIEVSFQDIDQMFQSDENSGDEALQVTTPPSSNKPSTDDVTSTVLPRTSVGPPSGILRQEELVKMFPTPPSMEHNPVASPLASIGLGDSAPEPPSLLGSPNHEPIQDWSYVFKPPVMCKFVGSSKYAPLTNLPSSSLPPVTLPSNCVYKPSWAQPHPEKSSNSSSSSGNTNSQNSHSNTSNAITSSSASGGSSTNPGSVPNQLGGSLVGLNQPATPGSTSAPSPGVWGGRARTPNNAGVMGAAAPAPPPYSSPATPHQLQYGHGPPKIEPPVPSPPEANSLVVNVLLTDTSFNIFRDHNFDSCTLCVCNAGPKCVGNIRGGDAGLYLPNQGGNSGTPPWGTPSPHPLMEDEPIRCNCGFSAVVNRRLSHRAGLFIEDEFEITGILEEPNEKDSNTGLGRLEMELMQAQCVVVNSSSNALYRAAEQYRPTTPLPPVNLLALSDSNQLSATALDQGRLAVSHPNNPPPMCKMEALGCSRTLSNSSVHRWGFLRAVGPACNQDIVRVMKSLQPLLQDAMQKKCSTRLWEAPTVSGPLTWRQFHRLAGRGADDRCEPQPIPLVVTGRDRDWVTLAPFAVNFWDKLVLEPYSYGKDIAYIVVAPDNDFILSRVRTFFKELSSVYELCRLGKHCPITKVLRDGILRVGKTAAQKLAKEPMDEWFSLLNDNVPNDMLKLYAQVCRHHLAPHLSQVTMDRTLLDPPENPNAQKTMAPDRPSPSPRSDQPNTPKTADSIEECGTPGGSLAGATLDSSAGLNHCGSGSGNSSLPSSSDDDGAEPPHVVVYLVEPFTLASDSAELQRLACVALLKAYNTVIANVPEHIRSFLSLQVISLESILEQGRSGHTNRRSDHMRSLAFSVFSQCRRSMVHSTNNAKALTGFGTAASNELFLKSKDEKQRAPYKVYTPAYVLAKQRDKMKNSSSAGTGVSGADGDTGVPASDHCSVLYVSYCLSEDQKWLLATATDEQGLIMESVTINIHIPNRSRRRKASARRSGLQKLMDFILGVMSQSVTPWRLVIGRVGRIGHGELKGWSWLLSRKSLLKASKHLKEICGQCKLLYPNDVPCILSACLVSLEPDSALRLMPDQFTPDERFSQVSVKCQLSTPQDVTATHILVFPTSATTQSSQTAFQEQQINGPDLGDEELFSVLDDDMPEGMGDFNDIFSTWADPEAGGPRSPTGSPTRQQNSAPGSPSGGLTPHQHSPYQHNAAGRSGDPMEEVGTVLQQPLALGFLVSTAPTGKMPRWFWSACPHLESNNPAFLKNALHLHSTAIQQNSDELLQQQTTVPSHPLDSTITTEILRYVLEGYNALSWLALDSNTRDRLSCLPVHMQVLMQLYHMTSALA